MLIEQLLQPFQALSYKVLRTFPVCVWEGVPFVAVSSHKYMYIDIYIHTYIWPSLVVSFFFFLNKQRWTKRRIISFFAGVPPPKESQYWLFREGQSPRPHVPLVGPLFHVSGGGHSGSCLRAGSALREAWFKAGALHFRDLF